MFVWRRRNFILIAKSAIGDEAPKFTARRDSVFATAAWAIAEVRVARWNISALSL